MKALDCLPEGETVVVGLEVGGSLLVIASHSADTSKTPGNAAEVCSDAKRGNCSERETNLANKLKK
jgi:hypothetical protein